MKISSHIQTNVEIIWHVLYLFTPLKLHCNSGCIIFLPSDKSWPPVPHNWADDWLTLWSSQIWHSAVCKVSPRHKDMTMNLHCCENFRSLACSGVPRGGWFAVFKPPPTPKFWRPSKIVPNSTRLWKLLKISEFRTPTPQDVWKKGSKILKLPRFAIILH